MEVSEYSAQFFAERAERANRDAELLVPDVSAALGRCPERVVDFGCGDGALLRWWQRMGAQSLIGVDQYGPDRWAKETGGLHARLDLTKPIDIETTADLVVCLEVAEHLPPEAADVLVATLCSHGKRVLFSAAPPGQGGTGHLNEQPMAYWAEKFAAYGYHVQDVLRHRLSHRLSPWYRANTVLVCHESALLRVPSVKICTATHRDCFWEVEDAVTTLTKSDFLPTVYGSDRWGMHRLSHDAEVGKMRSTIACETLTSPQWAGVKYSLWIDADQQFRPQQAVDLVMAADAHGWEFCSGLYSTKSTPGRLVHRVDGPSRAMPLGPYARPYQVDGVGFGFCCTRNDLFLRVAQDPRSGVKRAWLGEGNFVWDLFRQTVTEPRGDWMDPVTGVLCGPYWSEDTSFSDKATACGVPIWVQPQIFVGHIGRKVFGIGDVPTAGEDRR